MHSADFLLQALDQASLGRGFCAPNPAVGAVIVRDGTIIAKGYHHGPGKPHAEVMALNAAGSAAQGADIYVTLEPCNHHGRTPPCVDAISNAGIKNVYFGYRDPNASVKGCGQAELIQRGVSTDFIECPEINSFYQSYSYWLEHQKPWVRAKIAISLDGKIAGKNAKPVQLTSKKTNEFTHQCRLQSDILLTTDKTIINDDPQFNVRINNKVIQKPVVIVQHDFPLDKNLKIFKTASKVLIFTGDKQFKCDADNAEIIVLNNKNNLIDFGDLFNALGQRGFHDVWIEAGAATFSQLIMNKLVNTAYFYIAPTTLGGEAHGPWPPIPWLGEYQSIEWHIEAPDVVAKIQLSVDESSIE